MIEGKILDLGCVTGLAGQALREQGYQSIIGVDISKKSLDLARDKHIDTALHKADIQQALSFPENEFDRIICTAVLTNMKTSEIPIPLDGDTGYGNFNNMQRLVKKLEQRGVAGVYIEDQLFPQTNSFINGNIAHLST